MLLPQLPAEAYYLESTFTRERDLIFRRHWQPMAPYASLATTGDYVARTVAGVPVIVRNFDGELRAYKNVCAHRFSMVRPDGCGRSDRLRCQYHGWEYGEDGRVSKLPDGASFRGIQARNYRLSAVRVERFGPMVFINIAPSGPSFREALGPMADVLEEQFSTHELGATRTTERPVNWKVIVENAVESYHVPIVHPKTFSYYRPEERHEHELGAHYTRYLDLEPWDASRSGKLAVLLARLFRKTPTLQRMTHVHVFPNLLFYYGDLLSDFAFVEPLGPEKSRHVSWLFFPNEAPAYMRAPQRVFNALAKRQANRVFVEDGSVWAGVQGGVRHAERPGVLSAREERVFAFQAWTKGQLEAKADAPSPHVLSDENGSSGAE
jgi:phenylpropionate dioxygenase-like ring-hydroxylating dioxygenase large terminal subunit